MDYLKKLPQHQSSYCLFTVSHWNHLKRQKHFFQFHPHFIQNIVRGKLGSGEYDVSVKHNLSEGKCVITARTDCNEGRVTQKLPNGELVSLTVLLSSNFCVTAHLQ